MYRYEKSTATQRSRGDGISVESQFLRNNSQVARDGDFLIGLTTTGQIRPRRRSLVSPVACKLASARFFFKSKTVSFACSPPTPQSLCVSSRGGYLAGLSMLSCVCRARVFPLLLFMLFKFNAPAELPSSSNGQASRVKGFREKNRDVSVLSSSITRWEEVGGIVYLFCALNGGHEQGHILSPGKKV